MAPCFFFLATLAPDLFFKRLRLQLLCFFKAARANFLGLKSKAGGPVNFCRLMLQLLGFFKAAPAPRGRKHAAPSCSLLLRLQLQLPSPDFNNICNAVLWTRSHFYQTLIHDQIIKSKSGYGNTKKTRSGSTTLMLCL